MYPSRVKPALQLRMCSLRAQAKDDEVNSVRKEVAREKDERIGKLTASNKELKSDIVRAYSLAHALESDGPVPSGDHIYSVRRHLSYDCVEKKAPAHHLGMASGW